MDKIVEYEVKQVIFCTSDKYRKGSSVKVHIVDRDLQELLRAVERYVQQDGRARDYTGVAVVPITWAENTRYEDGFYTREAHLGCISYTFKDGAVLRVDRDEFFNVASEALKA